MNSNCSSAVYDVPPFCFSSIFLRAFNIISSLLLLSIACLSSLSVLHVGCEEGDDDELGAALEGEALTFSDKLYLLIRST